MDHRYVSRRSVNLGLHYSLASVSQPTQSLVGGGKAGDSHDLVVLECFSVFFTSASAMLLHELLELWAHDANVHPGYGVFLIGLHDRDRALACVAYL